MFLVKGVANVRKGIFKNPTQSAPHTKKYVKVLAIQKRTRTCVGRCCRRSQRLRFRSLCAFCDCKKQQQQQQQKVIDASNASAMRSTSSSGNNNSQTSSSSSSNNNNNKNFNNNR
ncbi:uncharacterized protein Dvir_GJ26648 [Drosophila virilis]|uniref:Uncharacterized protein n=1 Tax=Drosophila virilis TaxID=7244 RepID=A0A0Q9WMB4_DROVI|nr:uncharacterized protein Dvir_GJ26648 [Drosophila virilis]